MKLLIPLIIIGLCMGMYFMYISPTANEVKILSRQKASYDEVLLKSKEVGALRDDVFAEYNNISEVNINKLSKIVPDTFNSVMFANDMNALASKSNLVVKDFNIDPQRTEDRSLLLSGAKPNPYKATVVTLRLVGQYSSFAKFLKNLETSLRLVDVSSLTIRTLGGQKSTDDSLEYSLEMYTYSLR
jgi:Tfp pilus assembly protein PilO